MDLKFDRIVNARDLGGLPAGGRKVRPGCLLRTAFLAEASDSDVRKLQEMNLRAIFDFRSLQESKAAPDREVPGAEIILSRQSTRKPSAGAAKPSRSRPGSTCLSTSSISPSQSSSRKRPGISILR